MTTTLIVLLGILATLWLGRILEWVANEIHFYKWLRWQKRTWKEVDELERLWTTETK